MPVETKVEPLDSWVQVTVDETLSPRARSAAIAGFAREKLAEARTKNRQATGGETPYRQFVDGRQGAPLESVNPDRGVIVFEFDLVKDVIDWILARLVARSPRGPAGGAGTYREAHRLFADGHEIAPGGALPPAAEYSITNTVPYARRLEIGVTKSGRAFLVSVPNRIYDRVSADAARRFSRVAKIGFTYRALVNGGLVRGGKRSLRYPTITVRVG